MSPDRKDISRSYMFFALLIAVFIMSAFVPASWFGVETRKNGYTPIDFTQLRASDVDTYDNDDDGKVTWEELTRSTKYGDAIIAEAKNNPPSAETLAALNDPNNLTSSFSKNIYLASNQIINAGGVSAEEQQKIIEELITQEAQKVTSKKYLYSEIRVASSESRDTIKAYGNTVATIIQGIITEGTITKDAEALAAFASSQDQEGVSDIIRLKTESARIDAILKKLLALSVPPSASLYHITMLNQITLYRDVLLDLSKGVSDPIRAKIALDKYPDTLVGTLLIYKKLSEYFTLKNIVFNANESGYVFTIGYTLE